MLRTFALAALVAAFPLAAPAQDATPAPPTAEAVQALSDQLYAEACPRFEGGYSEPAESFDIAFRYESDDAGQPERLLRLFRVFCFAGAYNMSNMFFTWDEIEGLRPLSFAQPRFAVTYEGEDGSDAVVKSISITGLGSTVRLVNSAFDPEAGAITSNSYWRGLGDASSGGVWMLRDGEFVLQTYYVDGSYDEQINPVTIVDYTKPQKVK